MTKCPVCGSIMIWSSDCNFKDVEIEDRPGFASFFSCSNEKCKCDMELYVPDLKGEEDCYVQNF